MRTCARIVVATALALTLAVVVAACGGSSSDSKSTSSSSTSGSSSSTSSSSSGTSGGTINVLGGTAPDNLDPGVGYTTQAAEADWLVYLPLVTYKHVSGVDGGTLIPGAASALPTISADGKTYDLTMRQGIKFSDGTPVKASDFKYTIERTIKTNWGGKSFYTNYIVGASEYDKGKAKDISGITVDDASGKVTIKLTEAYGAFANILALPSSGLVPTGTPMKPLPNTPPIGAGAYKFGTVTPNRGYTLQRVAGFAAENIPDVPAGSADIDYKVNANTEAEAQQILNNQGDVFDWGDTIPPALLSQIKSQAKDRFAAVETPSTYYFFLNTTKAPFNNLKARQAVNYGIDREALSRLTSGFLKPSCYFLPEGLVGHPTNPCPYGLTPNLAKAKQLVQESGLAGTPITVWGQERQPRRQYIDYYTDMLNKIGFKATEKIIANDVYFPTIGNDKTDPQTGFADWLQDFPNPSDFYLLMDARSIQPTNNQNFSKVNDPKVQKPLLELNKVPTQDLDSAGAKWQSLDEYVAKQAYIAAYGAQLNPKFYSNKIDWASSVFHPLYGNDFSSLKLK
jgi:peptide/nickel transport system substrate-binding protein